MAILKVYNLIDTKNAELFDAQHKIWGQQYIWYQNGIRLGIFSPGYRKDDFVSRLFERDCAVCVRRERGLRPRIWIPEDNLGICLDHQEEIMPDSDLDMERGRLADRISEMILGNEQVFVYKTAEELHGFPRIITFSSRKPPSAAYNLSHEIPVKILDSR